MRLEALEALAKLFNNLWFEQIKRDITDSKVQAYLMVFEDAFPHLNHVIEFVRKSADVLTDGSPDREHWSRLQGEFESLRLLLGEEQVQHRPGPPRGVSPVLSLTPRLPTGRKRPWGRLIRAISMPCLSKPLLSRHLR